MKRRIDFLIIGSGIAGLSYALKVAQYGSVCMITKANEDESNTKYAQGGIAAVMYGPDSFEKHIQDTLIAGDGMCDEEIVRMVITESTERVNELIAWGATFDKNASGDYDLAKEGGHSEHRGQYVAAHGSPERRERRECLHRRPAGLWRVVPYAHPRGR